MIHILNLIIDYIILIKRIVIPFPHLTTVFGIFSQMSKRVFNLVRYMQ
jgi:hypothetical protein